MELLHVGDLIIYMAEALRRLLVFFHRFQYDLTHMPAVSEPMERLYVGEMNTENTVYHLVIHLNKSLFDPLMLADSEWMERLYAGGEMLPK